jgi:putative nucleotidyltransferase with HDIG domain
MIETSSSVVARNTDAWKQPIFLSEIISALSFALDLTEGAVRGHALRSCLLGMRIAKEAQIPADHIRELYYALLLKDIGCSSNSARMCQIVGGDDRAVKAGVKLEDWTKPHQPKFSTIRLLWKNVLPGASPWERVVRIAKIGLDQHKNNEELITLRCDRGASIIEKLGLGTLCAQGVRSLDEHYDGSGYPEGLTGERIPLLARIMGIAQHLDAFGVEKGPTVAMSTLHQRSGTWFDPNMVWIANSLHKQGILWRQCLASDDPEETRQAVLDYEPGSKVYLQADRIDEICEAFADVVDAKSPFTFRHSVGVANAADSIARGLGLPAERVSLVRRTALLHDIGKLAVSNSILDKPGKLTAAEFETVQEHPGLSRRILERVGAFREVAILAGEHHERLDGSGYPFKLSAADMTMESRIIGVADVYGALSENRPYRGGLGLDEIVSIMKQELPHRLDPDCFDALVAGVSKQQTVPETDLPFNLRPLPAAKDPALARA